MEGQQFEVRDMRAKEKFFVDDEYLNGYAKLCGNNATLVYLCLCRHADRNQECFPSVNLMAEKLGISRDSVMRGIKKLIDWGIVEKKRKRKENAQWLNNSYLLLDKKYWKEKPSRTQPLGEAKSQNEPSQVANEGYSQVAHSDSKDTHIKKDTHTKDTHIAETSSALEIPELLKDKQKHIRVIGLYAKAKKIEFSDNSQVSSFIKRNLRPAQNLSPYKTDRIIEVMGYLLKNADFKWTLETVGKYIDEDLHKLNFKTANILVG